LFSLFKIETSKNTIASLDGVRAIAALSVMGFHLNLIAYADMKLWNFSWGSLVSAILLSGGTGVTLFFVLSGFLLFIPYAKSLLFNKDWPSARQFYLRRILRIWPGYYVALFTLIILFQPQYLQPAHWHELFLFLVFFMDSSHKTFQQLNGPFWTLAVEWQFYMLLPLLTLLLLWLTKRVALRYRIWVILAFLLGMMAWGVGSRYIGSYYAVHPTQTLLVPRPLLNAILFFTYGVDGKFLEDFAVGMVLCTLYIYARQAAPEHKLTRRIHRVSWGLLALGLLTLLFAFLWHFSDWFHQGPQILNPISSAFAQWGELNLSVGYGLCTLAILFGPQVLRGLFEWHILRWIGMISYSLYMWHLYILEDAKMVLLRHAPHWPPILLYAALWVCALCVVIPFSYGMYKFIEKPGIALAGRLRGQAHGKRAVEPASTASVTPREQAGITRSQW
jgi:peptidoglycan/LPS O-acetylase OafA/YrhL